jgi:hypothetical protein
MMNSEETIGRELTEDELLLVTGGVEDYDGDDLDDNPMDIHRNNN